MYALLLALVVTIIGLIPLIYKKDKLGSAVFGGSAFLLWWLLFYIGCPSTVWMLFGFVGGAVVINLTISSIISCLSQGRYEVQWESNWTLFMPLVGIVSFVVAYFVGCPMFRASDYHSLIGEVKTSEWTTDMQQADPAHIMIVPRKLAMFMADKQLGEAEQALGSQYKVAYEYMTRQKINGELWWVVPLDYNGFSVWTSVGHVPGYVKVHAEDPKRPVELVSDQKYVYTPGAYFWDNLQRYLWSHGYMSKGLTEYSFEVDEDGKGWWVVSVFEPTIGFRGEKITGVAVVDPTSGETAFHPKDEVPEWVDRAVPKEFARNYMANWGEYGAGWVNSWWGKKGLVDPTPMDQEADAGMFVYGSDGEPYWFTGITSSSSKDEALVGLMYLHSRTGEVKYFKTSGLNEQAVLKVINNEIAYKNWTGSYPILYNFYGRKVWVSTVLGQNGTFKSVAMVDAETNELYLGDDQHIALRNLQNKTGLAGQLIAPTTGKERRSFKGRVLRVAKEVTGENTVYFLLLENQQHALSGMSQLSSELVFTRDGDEVAGTYIETEEDVYPLAEFDNLGIDLKRSGQQKEVQERVAVRKEEVRKENEDADVRKQVDNMSPEELKQLLQNRPAEKPE